MLKLLESDVQFPYADYGNRDFVMNAAQRQVAVSMGAADAAIAGQPRPVANFVIPKPQAATVSATVHVLFELK